MSAGLLGRSKHPQQAKIVSGSMGAGAGPAKLSISDRFGYVIHPTSTIWTPSDDVE